MSPRKPKVTQSGIVHRFAARLREVRISRGMTQAELARKAHLASSYIWRLESATSAPGIDVVDRLAESLGTTTADLLPPVGVPDPSPLLRERARETLTTLLDSADVPTLQMLCPLLARLAESPTRRR